MRRPSFASDNHSGVHPALMEAIVEVNHGSAAAYEQDPWSRKLKKLVNELFNACDNYMVFNGTAANVLSLQASLKSYEAALCTDISHLNVDECGAPEKIAGCKLITLPSRNGKIDIDELNKQTFRFGDQHFSQMKLLSLTQATEYGTVYSLDEVRELKKFCSDHNLFLHMDGARLANAAVCLNCSLEELTKEADILSFGGAKNGHLCGEMVVIRNQNLAHGFKYFRKQSLQLPAKTRFFAAPFLRYLENNLWAEIANHENTMAQYLGEQLRQNTQLEITQPIQANAVFALLPKKMVKPLREKFFFYVWNEQTFEIRLMTSFDTSREMIDAFVAEIKRLSNEDQTS